MILSFTGQQSPTYLTAWIARLATTTKTLFSGRYLGNATLVTICYLTAIESEPVFNNDSTSGLTIVTYGDRCQPGYCCPQGTPSMVPCPQGTYRAVYAGKGESDCTICHPGKFFNRTANIAVTGMFFRAPDKIKFNWHCLCTSSPNPMFEHLLYPPPTSWGGYTGITLSVSLSVRPSVRPSVRVFPEFFSAIFQWIFLKLCILLCHHGGLCTCNFGHDH